MQENQPNYAAKELAGDAISAGAGWLKNIFELISIEGQLAGVSLLRITIFMVAVALFGITAWLLTIASVAWLLFNWFSIPVVLLLMAVLSIVMGLLLLYRVKLLTGNLNFIATREQLLSVENEYNQSLDDSE